MAKKTYYLLMKKKGGKKWTRAIKTVEPATKADVKRGRERLRYGLKEKVQTRIVTVKQSQKYLKNKKRIRPPGVGKRARMYEL